MNLFKILLLLISTSLFSYSQDSGVEEIIWQKSEHYNLIGDRESSIDVLLKGIDSLQKNEEKNIFYLSSLYNYLGVRFQTYGHWDESAFSYIKSIEYLKENERYNILKSKVYLNLGLLYVKTKSSSAEYYLDIAEEIALQEDYHPVLFVLYKVTNRLKEGVKFAKRINDNQYLSNYYYLIARLNDSLSSSYFDSARIVLPSLSEAKLQNFQYHAFIVDFFIRNSKLDSALFHCNKAEEIAPLLNDDEVDHHYLKCYASVFLEMKDYKRAWKYKSLADSLRNLYMTPRSLAVLEEIDKQRVFFEKENKILLLESQKKVRTILIFVFLLLFVVVYRFVRKEIILNRKLKETNKIKDRLFAIISHDMRGVVASINLLSQDENPENFQRIRKGSKSLLFEFDNLLNWSLEHQDKIILYPKVLDLNEVIEEEVQLLENQISQKNINIMNQYQEDCIAFADENTIRIVLRNILHNAIKFSPDHSEVKIIISEENAKTKINILDAGCGFNVDHHSKGMGLGLELCKEFLEMNKSTLLIESSETGSKVSIELPNS